MIRDRLTPTARTILDGMARSFAVLAVWWVLLFGTHYVLAPDGFMMLWASLGCGLSFVLIAGKVFDGFA